MAGDGGALASLLGLGQREHERALVTARTELGVVHQEADNPAHGHTASQLRHGQGHHYREGAVVGVQVEERRHHEDRRAPLFEGVGHGALRYLVAVEEQVARALVGETEEPRVREWHSKLLESCSDLLTAARSKPRTVGGPDAPAQLERALRPRVVVAFGEEHHQCLRPDLHRVLEQPPGCDALVVRVRREHQEPVRRGERERLDHEGLRSAANGEYPRSIARAQTTAKGCKPAVGMKS